MTSPSDAARALAALRQQAHGACARCGKGFLLRVGAQYCSRNCRIAAGWERHRTRREQQSASREQGD